jgi:hypothetical protein
MKKLFLILSAFSFVMATITRAMEEEKIDKSSFPLWLADSQIQSCLTGQSQTEVNKNSGYLYCIQCDSEVIKKFKEALEPYCSYEIRLVGLNREREIKNETFNIWSIVFVGARKDRDSIENISLAFMSEEKKIYVDTTRFSYFMQNAEIKKYKRLNNVNMNIINCLKNDTKAKSSKLENKMKRLKEQKESLREEIYATKGMLREFLALRKEEKETSNSIREELNDEIENLNSLIGIQEQELKIAAMKEKELQKESESTLKDLMQLRKEKSNAEKEGLEVAMMREQDYRGKVKRACDATVEVIEATNSNVLQEELEATKKIMHEYIDLRKEEKETSDTVREELAGKIKNLNILIEIQKKELAEAESKEKNWREKIELLRDSAEGMIETTNSIGQRLQDTHASLTPIQPLNRVGVPHVCKASSKNNFGMSTAMLGLGVALGGISVGIVWPWFKARYIST